MRFGDKLKVLRVLNGYTQQTLAKAMNTQQSSMTRYENGDCVPHAGPMSKLTEALGEERNVAWLQKKSDYRLLGISIYKPLSPFMTYTNLTLRSVDNILSECLPTFVQEIGLIPRKILKASAGAVFYASDNVGDHALLIVVREDLIATLLSIFPDCDHDEILTDEQFLNLLLFSDLDQISVLGLKPGLIDEYKALQSSVPADTGKDIVTVTVEGTGLSEAFQDELRSVVEALLLKHKATASVRIELDVPASVQDVLDPKLGRLISSAGLKISGGRVVRR